MRVKLLLGNPSRDEVAAARELLIKNGFVPPMVGDWRHHTPGQLIEADCVVVGSGGLAHQDAYRRWVQVKTIADLAQVFPDADNRPELRKAQEKKVEPKVAEPEPEQAAQAETEAVEDKAEVQDYLLEDRGRGWFDVVDQKGRVQNEKALRQEEAEELLDDLKSGRQLPAVYD